MSAEAAFAVVEQAIAGGPIPGAAAAVDDSSACFGHLVPGEGGVDDGTLYDLASLTKVLVTIPLCLEAIAIGLIDPRAPLRALLPESAWMQSSPSLADATVLELATHTSGLPAWQPLYTLGLDRATLLARVLHTPLTGVRGSVLYSDLGHIVLGHLLERARCEPLECQAATLYARLGLANELTFRPAPERCAPTERCPWRGRTLRGEVHDENAFALDGVSGHAGLFGSLRGVGGFARAMLDGRLHAPAIVDFLSSEHARAAGPDGDRRGFGWILPHAGWSGGDLMSERALGHTGFTGTGLWIDLDRRRFSVLLTNRVHPSRHVESGIVGLRRRFNNAAFAN